MVFKNVNKLQMLDYLIVSLAPQIHPDHYMKFGGVFFEECSSLCPEGKVYNIFQNSMNWFGQL